MVAEKVGNVGKRESGKRKTRETRETVKTRETGGAGYLAACLAFFFWAGVGAV